LAINVASASLDGRRADRRRATRLEAVLAADRRDAADWLADRGFGKPVALSVNADEVDRYIERQLEKVGAHRHGSTLGRASPATTRSVTAPGQLSTVLPAH